jgi:hypothetical protein
MGKLGQKIEHVDITTKQIMYEIRDYFWNEHNIVLEDYYVNSNFSLSDGVKLSAYDQIDSIIHNNLKKTI